MRTELVTRQYRYQKLGRCLLLFVLVSCFLDPGQIYITEDNPHGYVDIPFYESASTLWKMVILLLVAITFLMCCHSRTTWAFVAPFIAFWVWLLISAAYNGLTVRMMLSFATLLTPVLFAGAFGTLFRFPEDIYLLKRVCLWSIVAAFAYGLSYRIFNIMTAYDAIYGTPLLTYIYFGNKLPLCACSMVAGAITAVELKNDYDRGKMVLLSFLFLIPILSGGRIYLIGGVFAYMWLFHKIFRLYDIERIVILIPTFVLGSLLMWGFYFEKTFGDSTAQISQISTSGRWKAWPEYWEFAMKEPFFGHGPGADFAYRKEYDLNIAGCSHNDYLGLLTYGGWPALLFFLLGIFWLFATILRSCNKERNYSQWYYASLMPIVFFLVVAIASNPLRRLSVMCVILAPVSMAIGYLYRQKVVFKNVSRTTVRHVT